VPKNLAEKIVKLVSQSYLNEKEVVMKKIALFALAVCLMVSGVTLAQQSGDEKKGSSMQDMMQQMMKQKQSGEGSTEGMGGMMGMMRMMEQCSDMMKSSQHQAEKAKETQKE
jgi:hypothetical protein